MAIAHHSAKLALNGFLTPDLPKITLSSPSFQMHPGSAILLHYNLYIYFRRAVILCSQTSPGACLQWTQNSALLHHAAQGVS